MSTNGDRVAAASASYRVFVEGLNCPTAEFKQRLVQQGMSAERADQVAQAIPCYVKKDVSRKVALQFGKAFQSAGAAVRIEAAGMPDVEVGLPPPPERPFSRAVTPEPVPSFPDDNGHETEKGWAKADGAEEAPEAEEAEEAGHSTERGWASAGEMELAPKWSGGDLELAVTPEVPAAADPRDAAGLEEQPPRPASPVVRFASGAASRAPDVADGQADAPEPAKSAKGPEAVKWGQRPKRKKVDVAALPTVEEEPWLKRRYPHIIIGVILLLVGSYLYGCTKVMAASGKLRRELSDVNRILENVNARGEVVTNDDVVAAVQEVGKRCGVGISRNHIEILGESLHQERLPGGVCHAGRIPDSFQLLPRTDQQMIVQNIKTCTAPDWIVTIRVSTTARWGLFSREIDATRVTWVRAYEP